METLLLTATDVRTLLPIDACIDAVEESFRQLGLGLCPPPQVLGMHVERGGFHVKAGTLSPSHGRFVTKINANFPGNRESSGLPTIQGVVVVFDTANGAPLAVMDSSEITRLRTAAATAVAVKHLAPAGEISLAICGCGVQGEASLEAITHVKPLRRAMLHDADPARAQSLAERASARHGIPVSAAPDFTSAARESNVIVTCTPSTTPILFLGDVAPGTLIAAVGADNPSKHEIATDLLASAVVVTDLTEQCLTMGDLHHAVREGKTTRDAVYAELGDIVAGKTAAPPFANTIVIFDSTGLAMQDVAAASLVLDRARLANRGTSAAFSA